MLPLLVGPVKDDFAPISLPVILNELQFGVPPVIDSFANRIYSLGVVC